VGSPKAVAPSARAEMLGGCCAESCPDVVLTCPSMSVDGVVTDADTDSRVSGCGKSHKDPAISKVAAATFTMCPGFSILFTVM
jgi:hypothetical protein